jgi:CBS domain containing-hemolysin-like protein
MLGFLIALLCLALTVTAMVLLKTYYYLPARELKRQAAHHDPLAVILWRAVGFGPALKVLLWVVAGVFAGIGLVLLSHIVPTALAIIAEGLLLLYVFAWLPNTRLSSVGGRLTVVVTPAIVWLLGYVAPSLEWLHAQFRHFALDKSHTGLYQHEDLAEVIHNQKSQHDNRIGEAELGMAEAALSFGKRKVHSIIVGRKRVFAVSADEDLGPVTLDELHKSNHSRFPVYQGKKDHFVGMLYLHDLVDRQGKGSYKVSEVMVPHVYYMHENDNLTDALHTFYQTKHQLFVVVNSFDEYVGIVTLEDILAQLMGEPVVTDLEQADDRTSVAARHPKKAETTEDELDSEPAEETTEESVPAPSQGEVADPQPSSE